MVIVMNIKGQWIHYNTMIIYDYNHYNTIIMNDHINGQSWMVRSQVISGPFFVTSNTTIIYTTRHITGELLQGSHDELRRGTSGNQGCYRFFGMVDGNMVIINGNMQDPPLKSRLHHTVGSGLWWIFRWVEKEEDLCSDKRPPCSCASVFFHPMVPLRRPFMNSWRMMPAGHLSDS